MGVSVWCVMRVYVVRASSCVNDMYEYAGASHTALHLLFRACLHQKVNHWKSWTILRFLLVM